ncbi:MAG: hypothetical protein HY764_02125 [Candidatus Portnoybacteria bacterium]|nr:hypothetical protein [Candidatus Portnoybacteria bacterium]
MRKYSIIIFFTATLLLALLPLTAFSAEDPNPDPGFQIVPDCGGGPCGLCDIFLLISNIFNFIAFKLAPPIAGFLFVLAGGLFLISGGSQTRISQAKKIFINTIFGLAIIYIGWLIVDGLIMSVGKSIGNEFKW